MARPLLMAVLAILIGHSPAACWGSGLGMQPQWIWSSPHARVGEQVRLRRIVKVALPLRRAELRGLADDRATVFIDQQLVGHIAGTRQFSVLDVTKFLTTGDHIIEIAAENDRGAAGVWLQCDLTFTQAVSVPEAERFVTDETWEARVTGLPGVTDTSIKLTKEFGWHRVHSFGLLGVSPWWRPAGELEDYDQWKRAIGTGQADEAARLRVVPGFQVELLRSSQKGEGSWVSLTFDSKGRVIVGREGPGILRMTFPPLPKGGPGGGGNVGDSATSRPRSPLVKEENVKVELLNDQLQECRGLLWAFDSLYANANNSKGLYRLRDTDGDDQLDDVKLLKATGGGVGHGRNALALGPDNMIYVIHGNNVLVNESDRRIHESSPLRFMAEDRLRPAFWDRFMFDADARPPAGYVARMDSDGKSWQVVAGGFRNPYGLDFNADGEMFTFDADNEGDQGAPWYRPTRFLHIVSGGDYGFRQGSANRPGHYAEHLPSNLNMGLASPTGVKSGHRSAFPGRYRQAVYVCDWSYGRIYALHLVPQFGPHGPTYRCRAELFLEGRPLNVTDLAFGPDGAMYFVTGGRGTQSGLYRVSSPAAEAVRRLAPAPFVFHSEMLDRRRQLERWHTTVEPQALDAIWPQLDSEDIWIRHAARVALEHQPLASWKDRALPAVTPGEPAAVRRMLAVWLALARVAGEQIHAATERAELQRAICQRVNDLPWDQLSTDQQMDAWRVYAVAFTRLGRPAPETAEQVTSVLAQQYPHDLESPNQRLGELLAYLAWPKLVETTIPRLEAIAEQEDKLAYLTILRDVPIGWTLDWRQRYFAALQKADLFDGGNLLPIAINGIREDALATLSVEERRELGALLEPAAESGPDVPATVPTRPLVREWKLEDFDEALKTAGVDRDAGRGQRLFRETLCLRCHRFGTEGRTLGPDLTFVANRFGPLDLLDHILTPAKAIDGKYRQTLVETKSGHVHVGRFIGGDDRSLLMATDPLRPTKVTRVAITDIESRKPSPVSPMPAGLLNSLTAEEVLDLLEFLRSGRAP